MKNFLEEDYQILAELKKSIERYFSRFSSKHSIRLKITYHSVKLLNVHYKSLLDDFMKENEINILRIYEEDWSTYKEIEINDSKINLGTFQLNYFDKIQVDNIVYIFIAKISNNIVLYNIDTGYKEFTIDGENSIFNRKLEAVQPYQLNYQQLKQYSQDKLPQPITFIRSSFYDAFKVSSLKEQISYTLRKLWTELNDKYYEVIIDDEFIENLLKSDIAIVKHFFVEAAKIDKKEKYIILSKKTFLKALLLEKINFIEQFLHFIDVELGFEQEDIQSLLSSIKNVNTLKELFLLRIFRLDLIEDKDFLSKFSKANVSCASFAQSLQDFNDSLTQQDFFKVMTVWNNFYHANEFEFFLKLLAIAIDEVPQSDPNKNFSGIEKILILLRLLCTNNKANTNHATFYDLFWQVTQALLLTNFDKPKNSSLFINNEQKQNFLIEQLAVIFPAIKSMVGDNSSITLGNKEEVSEIIPSGMESTNISSANNEKEDNQNLDFYNKKFIDLAFLLEQNRFKEAMQVFSEIPSQQFLDMQFRACLRRLTFADDKTIRAQAYFKLGHILLLMSSNLSQTNSLADLKFAFANVYLHNLPPRIIEEVESDFALALLLGFEHDEYLPDFFIKIRLLVKSVNAKSYSLPIEFKKPAEIDLNIIKKITRFLIRHNDQFPTMLLSLGYMFAHKDSAFSDTKEAMHCWQSAADFVTKEACHELANAITKAVCEDPVLLQKQLLALVGESPKVSATPALVFDKAKYEQAKKLLGTIKAFEGGQIKHSQKQEKDLPAQLNLIENTLSETLEPLNTKLTNAIMGMAALTDDKKERKQQLQFEIDKIKFEIACVELLQGYFGKYKGKISSLDQLLQGLTEIEEKLQQLFDKKGALMHNLEICVDEIRTSQFQAYSFTS